MSRTSKYKTDNDLSKRQTESKKILEKHPDRVPVICEKADNSSIPEIDKKKFLVPGDLTVGQFVYVIRKRINLGPDQTLYVYVNKGLPPTHTPMKVIYDDNRDEDGFLYVTYSGENLFGSDENTESQ
ncbi:GABA(A) receptor-associated protein (autophagy-like protein 8) [Fonticula alba]|uniref:Autophagy-related protein n=1 Tax=Fonticula alba TaxID=691883 RepID=A0A058ZE98_FONAL|nr:GABA(A) receptor-associated protein (autophagy-like protein 8) [Fonticula alba]KCV72694.1 GABA(A) receptor-associated protein (autophagy-like protein 8) [Fonticula alba]|eukprot:XP_009492395.1 GABA(A) receptor-associated protein (autophagy-like protein 8) [Fonticula alba]